MKKLLVLLLIVVFQTGAFASSYVDKQLKETKKNVKYNSVKIHSRNYNYADQYIKPTVVKDIKDPGLIKLSDVEPLDETLYKKKLADDENKYEKEILPILNKKNSTLGKEPMSTDFYKIYRIAERIIRANNLEYMNWRIALKKETEEFNASAQEGNLITIYTSAYDSLYTNEDALAFIIAHEMSHIILNHQQRMFELNKKLNDTITMYKITTAISPNQAPGAVAGIIYKVKKMFGELKMMEYMADSEGLILTVKAGYKPSQAISAMNFMDALPQVYNIFGFDTHPVTAERIKSLQENIMYANPEWVEEGKSNIYHSNVLNVKKSSDRVSIVINEDPSIARYYEVENMEKRLTRLAYTSYKRGDMNNAVKYFEKLENIDKTYVPCLYLSYANEYLYKTTKDNKYLKKAKSWAQKAKNLQGDNPEVAEQINSL